MPAPFKKISREQFAELLSKFPFERKINAVHMHHTWKPNRAQYRGHDTIVGMWRFHTETNGWSDIAQHITIAPDGAIWLGRDWNRAPASAAGHNGNAQAGPFMFEMIGNFDEGMDPFDGAQRETALEVIARVQQRFGLPAGSLQLHNMMSTKSCPGTSIDYQTILHDVEIVRDRLQRPRGAPQGDMPFSPDQVERQRVVQEAIEDLARSTGRGADPADAEPCTHGAGETEGEAEPYAARGGARGAARGIHLNANDRTAMAPHVINLRMGRFSDRGDWTTSSHDVDAIFERHLPAALKAARGQGRPLRLMFYAHGGLNDEAHALAAARTRIGWWKSNGIYPIHFIWETGLAEVVGQMLERFQQGEGEGAASRNLFSDHVSDPLIETFAHGSAAVNVWSAMKWSAEQSSRFEGPAGAASYVAERLAAFCQANPNDIEIHAAGHSAGAIFHAWFIPCALARGVPRFDSLHLMAPAMRVDLFQQNLAARIGPRQGIDKLTLYTMADSFEKEDSCGGIYRKSLLYLIYRGLEPDRDEPILGLERCIRADPDLKHLFGLAGGPRLADLVWSDNGLDRGRCASRSRTHGGFDDDPATMGSIVRRVLGKDDAERIVELPAAFDGRGADPWQASQHAWNEREEATAQSAQFTQSTQERAAPGAQQHAQARQAGAGGGRRRALCVGIDDYPTARLYGCVNDARAWAAAFSGLGFARPRMLLDRDATRAGIVGELAQLVDTSRPGDVLVFQFAGHGTQVPDLDGEEADGDTPGLDEALCPVDFDGGDLVIDDDLRAIIARLPGGVNLTCFFDCCHSGTVTRLALGGRTAARTDGRIARFVPASRQLIDNFRARRQAGATRAARALPGGGEEAMREVVFSACLSSELALESQGQGDFTRHALQVLRQHGANLSNGAFAEHVTRAFGASPRQHAKLYSSEAGRMLPLFAPVAHDRPTGAGAQQGASKDMAGEPVTLDEVRAQLARISELLAHWH
jgi:hypothetical protein